MSDQDDQVRLKAAWDLEQAGRIEEAERLYRDALDAGEPDAAYYLGELLIQRGRPEEAIPLLQGIVSTRRLRSTGWRRRSVRPPRCTIWGKSSRATGGFSTQLPSGANP